MKILVTGGAGFIGSTLVDRLLAEGHSVDVIDNLTTGSLSNLADARSNPSYQLSFYNLDVRSVELVELMARLRPEVVYHLAAQVDVRVSVARPILDADVNVLGTLRVLEGAREAGNPRVVFTASGGTLYGEPDPSMLPIKETFPWKPLSPYGVSKLAGIEYLALYKEMYGIDYCALALSNVYGPRQDANGEAGVVAIFAGCLASGMPVTIYGDGTQTRDFVYVDDVVDALVRGANEGGGMVINIGSGQETSINQLYDILADAWGSKLPPVYAPPRPGEVMHNCLDPSLAHEVLGWKPWTSLEEGVRAVVQYYAAVHG